MASELERPFVDADEQLEQRAGRTIPRDLRETTARQAFRRLEAEVLADLLGRARPAGDRGGRRAWSPEPGNRALLASPGVRRLAAGVAGVPRRPAPIPTHRPLLAGEPDPAAALDRLVGERAPLYAEVADATVDVEPFHAGDDKPKRALAGHIAELVEVHAEAPR